jgi:hypothetical protein
VFFTEARSPERGAGLLFLAETPMKKFEYLTVPVALARDAFASTLEPDSYVSQSEHTIRMEEILQQGYRWVRSDNDYAIFEREIAVKKPDPPAELRIYLALDPTNNEIHVLTPHFPEIEVFELWIDSPDPENTDRAEFRLLKDTMKIETTEWP